MTGTIRESQDFDSDVMSASTGAGTSHDDVRTIITAIARASHAIAELVSLGELAFVPGQAGSADAIARAAIARHILVEHLTPTRVKTLYCAGDAEPATLDQDGPYVVTIDPLEGAPDAEANLPFGTIFSICRATDAPSRDTAPAAAGFIHYGPQTNLVISLGAGVHIFYLDRSVRTYRLAAENVRIPEEIREWAIDATKRGRWSPLIRSLIDEQLEAADAPGAAPTDMRWTGSLTADAYRILRRGGVYLCPEDDQPGRENACPNLRYAARPIAFIIEQAGGRATTGTANITHAAAVNDKGRTPFIFGSSAMVSRIERLHALPESTFDRSPLFRQRGLFRARGVR